MKKNIERAWQDKSLLNDKEITKSIHETIEKLDKGEIRVASEENGKWIVNEWVKKAVILYFSISKMGKTSVGIFEFHDKIALKKDYDKLNVRVVPHAIARYGSYLAPGVVLMPSYVNIGAYVDSNTMVDNYVTVGSCAQIGKNIHLSAGVVIGGVLEPLQASPVIIEDGCFIGAQSVIVEGVHVKKEAVIASNVNITQSTKIIDVSGETPIEYKGIIPERSVVIQGSRIKKFPAGEYNVPCALIIGKRKESTDKKTSLNQALRDYKLSH
jgi:2,3,4,5-tetrahydropyridine-2,6-dicarboxylate N-succinyltransferase